MSAFFAKVDKIKPVYDVAYKVVLFICKLLLGGPRTFLARPKFHYTIVLEVLSSDFRINTAQKELPKFGHYYLLIFNKNFAIIFIEGKGKRKQQKEIKKS